MTLTKRLIAMFTTAFQQPVFHLMRVVEFALMRLAKLAGDRIPKPSWGTVLQQLERLAFQMKNSDLPVSVRPHLEF